MLEPVQLDTSVALGVIPVGTAVLSETTGVPAYLGEKAAEIEMVGTVAAPNLEKIVALSPDLIIGTESRHGDMYEQLAAIAPTVYMATQTDPWQDNVQFVAEALNKTDQAGELLGDYTARCEEVASKHSTEGKTAQLIRPRDDVLTLYGPRRLPEALSNVLDSRFPHATGRTRSPSTSPRNSSPEPTPTSSWSPPRNRPMPARCRRPWQTTPDSSRTRIWWTCPTGSPASDRSAASPFWTTSIAFSERRISSARRSGAGESR